MTKVVCVKAGNERNALEQAGDIIGDFADDHLFGQHIYDQFDVIEIHGVEQASLRDIIRFKIESAGAQTSKYAVNISSITPAERNILENLPGVVQDKIDILFAKMEPNV